MGITDAGSLQLSNANSKIDTLSRMANTAHNKLPEKTAAPDNFTDYLLDANGTNEKISGAQKNSATHSRYKVDPQTSDEKKLYQQCEALETFMLKTLVNGMRKTVEKSEFSSGGFAGEMYEDMLYDEYSADFAKNAGFGFAELAYLELTGKRGKRTA
ncbi:MAG: rod-binding protein [Spirochaetaceae bacterium]|jgi:flagellar protein FlgJ|nr:rod-binding protein [Spirochaetaceae bacterium]